MASNFHTAFVEATIAYGLARYWSLSERRARLIARRVFVLVLVLDALTSLIGFVFGR